MHEPVKLTRIAMFIDGSFFLQVNTFYKYHHDIGKSFYYSGFLDYVRHKVAQLEHSRYNLCPVIEAHWFRGRYPTAALENRYPETQRRLEVLTNERKMEDTLIYQGIVSHYFPLQVDQETGETQDKPINVWFALEAMDLAIAKKFDVLVIVGGDSEYRHLVSKLNGLGVRVMVLGWNVQYDLDTPQGTRRRFIKTSQALMDECSYPVWIDKIIDQGMETNDRIVMNMFNY
ncbi:MAG: hypothetical protein RLZZ77_1284 [Bacteroidota bacterium]|jgi:uncharacterized LabA/DUF88 family protein